MSSFNVIDNTFGIVVYDVRNGTGAIIINDSRYDNDIILNHNDLFNKFDSTTLGCKNTIWEVHGYALVKNNQIFFESKSNSEYDETFNDGWKIDYFKYNVYNQYGRNYIDYENDNYHLKNIDKCNSVITSYLVSKL